MSDNTGPYGTFTTTYTVAEHLVDTLAQPGVRQIYGIVGDSLNPVSDALRRGGKIRWVDVRHEKTSVFAAGAETQLTGKLAVCAGSAGPGNLHLINGPFDARRSAASVLAIAAHIPSSEVGTGYFQETHPDQLFRECSVDFYRCYAGLYTPRTLDVQLDRAEQGEVGIPTELLALTKMNWSSTELVNVEPITVAVAHKR